MTALDTNAFIRLMVNDDPGQVSTVLAILQRGPVYISLTVLLEANWVLSSVYGYTQEEIVTAFRHVSRLDRVKMENEAVLTAALRLAEEKVDLADALHLAATPDNTPFLTFDRTFIRRAKRAGAKRIEHAADYLAR